MTGGRPRQRTLATWRPRRARGVRLAGGRYVVHADFDVVEGLREQLGRQVEVELTPGEAYELADALVREADLADEYQERRRVERLAGRGAALDDGDIAEAQGHPLCRRVD